MQKKTFYLLTSLVILAVLLFTPLSAEAKILRPYPEFGPEDVGVIFR